jgi:hypothetical protein
MKSYTLYSFFKNWDTKTCLWTGMALFALLTISAAYFHAEKEYVMAFFGLTGQLVAGLLTYVNSNKTNPTIVDNVNVDKTKIIE